MDSLQDCVVMKDRELFRDMLLEEVETGGGGGVRREDRGGYGHHGHDREAAWKKRKGETEDAILRKNDVNPIKQKTPAFRGGGQDGSP